MQRCYRWAAHEKGGLEHLELDESGAAIAAEGVVIGGGGDEHPFGCRYAIRCDAHWRVRRAEVRVAGRDSLLLESDGEGNWSDARGRPLPALAGCVDVDLSCTPFTNTLPIRRLGPRLRQRQAITVAYIDVPGLAVGPSHQAYTWLAPGRYLFESLSNPFRAEIETDLDGLVLRYPGLFSRVGA